MGRLLLRVLGTLELSEVLLLLGILLGVHWRPGLLRFLGILLGRLLLVLLTPWLLLRLLILASLLLDHRFHSRLHDFFAHLVHHGVLLVTPTRVFTGQSSAWSLLGRRLHSLIFEQVVLTRVLNGLWSILVEILNRLDPFLQCFALTLAVMDRVV